MLRESRLQSATAERIELVQMERFDVTELRDQ